MKKLFLVGALAASMAFSSSALAAVDYGQNENLTVSYDGESTVSVTTNLSTYAGDQMTVLVLNNDDGSVEDTDIMYIDQAAAPTAAEWENGTKIFQNMGLLMPTEKDDEGKDVPLATLPTGIYTVKVGGTNLDSASLLKATIVVSADEEKEEYKIMWGDANGDGGISPLDSATILKRDVGGATQFTSVLDGKTYVLGETYGNTATGAIMWGDSNGDGGISPLDSATILKRDVGGATQFTSVLDSKTYALGETYTITK